VCLCTSDAYVVLSVCDGALLIMVDSCRWLYLVVTFTEVKAFVAIASLRAKTGINAIFPLSKKDHATKKHDLPLRNTVQLRNIDVTAKDHVVKEYGLPPHKIMLQLSID
jgi:hypothetical protein